jgi:uncharacterized membrane protein
MSSQESHKAVQKPLRMIAGIAILVLGVALILAWWPSVVGLVQGFLGIALAVAGLLVLYSLK